jgi:hypothetical protein
VFSGSFLAFASKKESSHNIAEENICSLEQGINNQTNAETTHKPINTL